MSFRLHRSNNALIFQAMSVILTQDDMNGLALEVEKLKHDHSLVVLDLSKLENIDDQLLSNLAHSSKQFLSKRLRVMVLAQDSIIAIIKERGYSDSLPCYEGIVSIFNEELSYSENQKVDSTLLIHSSLEALKESIKTYAKLELKLGKIESCTQQQLPRMDIAGVGSFFCSDVRGSLVLAFDRESYLKITSTIMKQPFLEFEPRMSDWAGEFVNAMLGRLKTDMKLQGHNCTVGIPTVFIGKDLEMFSSSKLTKALNIVKCSSEFGELLLVMMLNSPSENRK